MECMLYLGLEPGTPARGVPQAEENSSLESLDSGCRNENRVRIAVVDKVTTVQVFAVITRCYPCAEVCQAGEVTISFAAPS